MGPGAPMLAGTIDGVRQWELVEDRDRLLALGSIVKNVTWPPGKPMVAKCPALPPARKHLAPGRSCGCGLYAYHPFRARYQLGVLPGAPIRVTGVIRAWGPTELHEAGFRARFARVAALFIDQMLAPGDRSAVEWIASRYGAEAIKVATPDAVTERIDSLNGLSAEVVLDLLSPKEVRMTPAAEDCLTKAGLMRGRGFVFGEAAAAPRIRDQRTRVPHPGLMLFYVDVTGYRTALQRDEFEPGSRLRLVAEEGETDSAVAIYDESGKNKVGYAPRRVARRLGRWMKRGRAQHVHSAWIWQRARTGRRAGLHIVVSRKAPIHFHTGPAQLQFPQLDRRLR